MSNNNNISNINKLIKAKSIQIKSLKNQSLVADKCIVAESFFRRLKGLIGRKSLKEGEGLLITRCKDIHMWFMRVPIDVVFLRTEGNEKGTPLFRVTSVREQLQPWHPF